jgi:lipopolysaccharide/colanic/teichoic acid biosynthesis glycosyltransferase
METRDVLNCVTNFTGKAPLQLDSAVEQSSHDPLHALAEANDAPLIELIFREPTSYIRARRAFDVVFGLFVSIAALPMVLLASLAILVDDGGPLLFRQRRVGRCGPLFTMYKLRTMRKTMCRDDVSPTSERDARITRVGRWLRILSIDELPQLINVLRGDMTFVGPRPEMPFVVRAYEPWQHLRHLVTPGLTGLWQTTCRSTVPMHLPEATLLDLGHVRARSHRADALVLLKTVRKLISTQGAC